VTIDNLDAAGWETMLATTLAGSTFDGADITTVNFADNFKVVGNTLTIVTDTALEPGLDGANFANAGSWTDGLPSSSRPGTITVDATNLVRAVSSLGGAGWTINHTAGDLQFDGGWNVYGAGSTYNLSGGSIVLTIGDSVSDEGNFLVNAIEFNLGGDTAVDIAKSFGIGNVGVMNFLAGSGTLTAATLGQTSGMMNFTKDWIGSATIDSLNAASWEALLATTLAGSTLDGVDITPENFASNFRVVGSTLTLPPQGTLISIQ